jgi:SAM-dependent methyltransferase
MKITNCYNCHSENRIFYAAENGYSLVKCCECGLLYLEDRPEHAQISQAHMQGKHAGLKELDVTGVFNISKVPDYLIILDDIFKGVHDSKKDWLDIGCGHGEFIVALQKYSSGTICATGSEPNVHKQEAARKRGLNVSYFDIESLENKYDVISLLNVYSHLPDPPEFIKSLKKNMNPHSELIIETGDTADFSEKDHYRPFYLPDHLSFASERIVTDILLRLGFEIVSIHKYPYSNSPPLAFNPMWLAKEILKAVLPSYKSKIQEYLKIYFNRNLWSKTDMYIRARLTS